MTKLGGLVLALAVPASAAAQVLPGAELSAGRTSPAARGSALLARPAVTWLGGAVQVDAEALTSVSGDSLSYQGAHAGAAFRLRPSGGFGVVLATRAAQAPGGRCRLAADARFSWASWPGVWLGAGMRGGSPDRGPWPGTALLAGGRGQVGGVDFQMEVEYGSVTLPAQGSAPVPPGDSSFLPPHGSEGGGRVRSTTGRLSLFRGRAQVTFAGGVTGPIQATGTTWAHGQLALSLSPQLALFVTAGRRGPDDLPDGIPGQPFVLTGVRLRPGPALVAPIPRRARERFRLERVRGEVYVVRMRAPDARDVEIAGDVTAWTPVALTHDGDDRWRAELVLAPGVHHLAVRVNGGPWTAPPGLPVARDGFGGEVGVVVVP